MCKTKAASPCLRNIRLTILYFNDSKHHRIIQSTVLSCGSELWCFRLIYKSTFKRIKKDAFIKKKKRLPL